MEWHLPRLWVCMPLVILCSTIKSRSSLLASAHPDGPGKRAVRRLWCGGGGGAADHAADVVLTVHDSDPREAGGAGDGGVAGSAERPASRGRERLPSHEHAGEVSQHHGQRDDSRAGDDDDRDTHHLHQRHDGRPHCGHVELLPTSPR